MVSTKKPKDTIRRVNLVILLTIIPTFWVLINTPERFSAAIIYIAMGLASMFLYINWEKFF